MPKTSAGGSMPKRNVSSISRERERESMSNCVCVCCYADLGPRGGLQ